jgi:hypothetical protein
MSALNTRVKQLFNKLSSNNWSYRLTNVTPVHWKDCIQNSISWLRGFRSFRGTNKLISFHPLNSHLHPFNPVKEQKPSSHTHPELFSFSKNVNDLRTPSDIFPNLFT